MIEGVLGDLKPEGTLVALAEAGEGVTQEALESFAEEVPVDGGHNEDVHVEVECEEHVLEVYQRSTKATRCSLRLRALMRSIPSP